jgi:hypothetical protein
MTHTANDFAGRTTPQEHRSTANTAAHKELLERVKGELKLRGATPYDLWLPETHYLPHLLHKNEHIMGSVYGKYKDGKGALIATDQRVLFLDKKPMFMHVDELTFMIIGGVTFTKSLFTGYVTLHSRLGDYKLRTFNFKNAINFIDYIEAKCLQQAYPLGDKFEHST